MQQACECSPAIKYRGREGKSQDSERQPAYKGHLPTVGWKRRNKSKHRKNVRKWHPQSVKFRGRGNQNSKGM